MDRSNSMPVAIVNEAFARQYFPKGPTLGRRIKLGELDSKEPWLTIVGIVGDVSRPTLFEGYSQAPPSSAPAAGPRELANTFCSDHRKHPRS